MKNKTWKEYMNKKYTRKDMWMGLVYAPIVTATYPIWILLMLIKYLTYKK